MAKNYYSLKEIRSIVFNDMISMSLILKLVNNNEIPSERYGGRILIPTHWVQETIEKSGGSFDG